MKVLNRDLTQMAAFPARVARGRGEDRMALPPKWGQEAPPLSTYRGKQTDQPTSMQRMDNPWD